MFRRLKEKIENSWNESNPVTVMELCRINRFRVGLFKVLALYISLIALFVYHTAYWRTVRWMSAKKPHFWKTVMENCCVYIVNSSIAAFSYMILTFMLKTVY